MITTNDDEFAEIISMLRKHGGKGKYKGRTLVLLKFLAGMKSTATIFLNEKIFFKQPL